MILKDILDYFDINVNLPEYLYCETFSDVFLRGELKKENGRYIIVAETRKDVIHTMIIDSGDDYPVVISSELPNGKTNGIKFSKTEGDLTYI